MRRSAVAGLTIALMAIAGCAADPTTTFQPAASGANNAVPTPTPTAAPTGPVEPIGALTSTLVVGTGFSAAAQELLSTRFAIETIERTSIEHVVTVTDADPPIQVLHYLQDGWFCATAMNDQNWVTTGCTQNDQMTFGSPFLRRVSTSESGVFRVWVSNAENASFFVVETDKGTRFTSNVLNLAGYVLVNDGGVPVEARLLNADGSVVWSAAVET